MTNEKTNNITSVLKESRSFPPPAAFQSSARIKSMAEYEELWKYSVENPEEFWAKQATNLLHWHKPFTRVLDWKIPHAEWFADGEVNVSYNCLDRHVENGLADKTAILWEGEPGDVRKLSYAELLEEVCKCANGLKSLGVNQGDRVTLYMPMIPELAIATLACARIGATHSVVFGGFSAEALADRNNDAQAKIVITADGGYRRGSVFPLKDSVDASLEKSTSVEKVLVVKRTNQKIVMKEGRDFWWDDVVGEASSEHVAESFPSEHPLFILYTSGSTGKPKGILHTSAGYLLGATLSFRYIFDLKDNAALSSILLILLCC